MNAGDLNTRVTVQQLVAGQDAAGQPVLTWSTFATIWAHVLHKKGIEVIKGSADTSVVHASIRIRYRSGINAGMRVLVGGGVYNINALLPDLVRREYIDLVCEAINAQS